MADKTSIGETIAISLSRLMATWIFIGALAIILAIWVIARNLIAGAPLDVFNLGVSLFTLFLDLIILKATISLRNMDRTMMDMMLKIDRKILAKEDETIKLLKELMIKRKT